MRRTSPMLVGMVLLAGAAGLLWSTGNRTPDTAAQATVAWLTARQLEPEAGWVQPSRAPETSLVERMRSSPSPSPVPVYTVEEAWDEVARQTEEEPEPVEVPVDAAETLELRNNTELDMDLTDLPPLPEGLDFRNADPAILIVHTHTTECYADPDNPGVYRATDENDGVMAVGDALAETLERRGYAVFHDKSYCDYPEYEGAYDRSRDVMVGDLEEYPSICLVLDLHRDAVEDTDGSQLRMATEVEGEETAQVMLVVGTDEGGLYHPDWRQNLAFGALLQLEMEREAPGIMRPINLRNQRFNQDLGPLGLLLEVGASGNSLEEAERAAACLGEGLATVLDRYSGENP